MNIHLDLPNGKYREMTKEEFKELNRLLADSSKIVED
jgi:23S rRNA pseudouridine2604 synthase